MRLRERFEEKYMPEPMSGCWLWLASVDGKGYGQFNVWSNGKNKLSRAHRVSYELYKGPIPEGMFLCHRCDNKRCVNPDHVFIGTQSDNMQDLANKGLHPMKRKTHCKYGHAYDEGNTKWFEGKRQCRICRNLWSKAKRAKLKEKMQ